VKGRPADNPLIEHIASWRMLDRLVTKVPEKAKTVMEAFWPGPLTCVLPASDLVPRIVTAGLSTVAVRWPSSVDAQRLILEADLPIAAPSANTSGKPSPTCAEDVLEDLKGRIPMILDGGSCCFGVESTVITFVQDPPMILRPGGVTKEQIEGLIGPVEVHASVLTAVDPAEHVPSPGMKHKHYAPKAKVIVYRGSKALSAMLEAYDTCEYEGGKPWLFVASQDQDRIGTRRSLFYGNDGEDLARHLFHSLRQMDSEGATIILCQAVSTEGIGLAAMNRLLRAAEFDVIDVC
jgi:L-threonylcarbamoyladenylate synthase